MTKQHLRHEIGRRIFLQTATRVLPRTVDLLLNGVYVVFDEYINIRKDGFDLNPIRVDPPDTEGIIKITSKNDKEFIIEMIQKDGKNKIIRIPFVTPTPVLIKEDLPRRFISPATPTTPIVIPSKPAEQPFTRELTEAEQTSLKYEQPPVYIDGPRPYVKDPSRRNKDYGPRKTKARL